MALGMPKIHGDRGGQCSGARGVFPQMWLSRLEKRTHCRPERGAFPRPSIAGLSPRPHPLTPPSTNEIPLTHRHCCGLPLLLLSHQAWASYRGLGDPTASLWCSFGTPVLLSLPTITFCDKVVHIQCTCRRGDSGVDSLCTYIQGSCRRCHT